MQTKLSRYFEGIIEAAWLAAVILIPIFFNIYSSRIFEPDKIAILRTLALVILAAWVIKIVDEGRVRWEIIGREESIWKSIRSIPLAIPVISLAIVYIVATLFSVTPRVSLFGSYQRLQGTYTTLSYLVLFAAIAGNLRKREQVGRLITTLVLVSLPISLYGVLQRYQIDPVPWGGNVSRRIASNMGNSIFVAAYLIMVFPLTIGRIVESFTAILRDSERMWSQVARATIYVFIASLQLIALYMSGSRGPALGWMAGTFFMVMLLSLYWRKRWLTVSFVVIGALVGIFLIIFNIENGPLEKLRESPAIGRFGLLLDPESNSALVRKYIWEGAYDLVSPHEPLQFPDGDGDIFNFLRPLIGYGPEAMYVAYNSFYPPELGHVEKRNASPDRSHNETWDSMVITGGVGLAVYIAVFISVFYFGLKWIGLIQTKRFTILFFILSLGGGLIGAIGLSIWRGVEYLGVGLPFGVAMGLLAYMTIIALIGSYPPTNTPEERGRALVLIALLSAIIAHFLEINFGIAIVATRTYFWTYAALMLVVGYILPKYEADHLKLGTNGEVREDQKPADEKRRGAKAAKGRPKRTERSNAPLLGNQPAWVRVALIGGILTGLILTTLGYDFITNSKRYTSVPTILVSSVTRLPNRDNALSYGVLAMVSVTWLAIVIVYTAENDHLREGKTWLKAFAITLGSSLGVFMIYWFLHAAKLAALAAFVPANQQDIINQVSNIGGLLTNFYIYAFALIFLLAFFLPAEWPYRGTSWSSAGLVAVPLALIAVIVLAYLTNIKIIQADIAFKMAEPFTKNGQWAVATILYKRALELAPNEDHYYLFLGRSYLEQAKLAETPEEQEDLIRQAESDLKVAQKINPLNTDHTANLGRLYSWWAGRATDGAERTQRGEVAASHYQMATTLSPNNPTLWDEWAILYFDVLRQPEAALERLNQSLKLDAEFSWTQSLLGDYYARLARAEKDTAKKAELLEKAISHYEESVRVATNKENAQKLSSLVALGNLNIEIANLDPQNIDQERVKRAIDAFEAAVELNPKSSDLWKIEETIARLYAQLGDLANALIHAQAAFEAAPDDQKEKVEALISQIQTLP